VDKDISCNTFSTVRIEAISFLRQLNDPTSIWNLSLANGFRGAILASLTPYVTSDFSSHSLLTVIEMVAGAMTSAVYIPMAKLLDVWGRAEGFALMVAFTTLGMVLMAVSQNLPTFCAAQVSISELVNLMLDRH
jgi:MFS family permease